MCQYSKITACDLVSSFKTLWQFKLGNKDFAAYVILKCFCFLFKLLYLFADQCVPGWYMLFESKIPTVADIMIQKTWCQKQRLQRLCIILLWLQAWEGHTVFLSLGTVILPDSLAYCLQIVCFFNCDCGNRIKHMAAVDGAVLESWGLLLSRLEVWA